MAWPDVVMERLGDLVGESDAVGVACSGGADSIALLSVVAHRWPGRVEALHVDHALRDDSAADARFVAATAAELGVLSHLMRTPVDAAPGGSVEAVARELRYAALEKIAVERDLDHVATAHTLDDQAETVLLRILRGTGTAGLGGIAAKRGRFVRPMLRVRRAEVRTWLRERSIAWREDPTNADTRFERNWLRHDVLPVIAARRPGAVRTIARLADLARADDLALDALADDVFSRASMDDTGVLVAAEDLVRIEPAIASRVVRRALWSLGEEPTADDVVRVLALSSGRVRSARCGSVVAVRIAEGFAFLRPTAAPDPVRLPQRGVVSLPEWGIAVRVGPSTQPAWTWRTTVPDGSAHVIRARRPGDRVVTSGGTRKVQDVLVDAKVPAPLRDFVGVVATDRLPIAVVALTSRAGPGSVVDVEPLEPTWSRSILWTRAS